MRMWRTERNLGKALGDNVARLRSEQGISRSTLSRMTGISRQLLIDIERGTADVRLSYVQKLSDVFCVDALSLLIAPSGE